MFSWRMIRLIEEPLTEKIGKVRPLAEHPHGVRPADRQVPGIVLYCLFFLILSTKTNVSCILNTNP